MSTKPENTPNEAGALPEVKMSEKVRGMHERSMEALKNHTPHPAPPLREIPLPSETPKLQLKTPTAPSK
jgi:hypothetical protein